jgi:hypothetical protein
VNGFNVFKKQPLRFIESNRTGPLDVGAAQTQHVRMYARKTMHDVPRRTQVLAQGLAPRGYDDIQRNKKRKKKKKNKGEMEKKQNGSGSFFYIQKKKGWG